MVFLVTPMGHGRPVKDLAGILDIGNPGSGSGTSLVFGKGVSNDIFRQGFLTVPVIRGDAVSGMHAETAVMPGHEFFDKPVVYPALSLQHGQDLGAEDLFEFFKVWRQ
jgi:hypothetical protein